MNDQDRIERSLEGRLSDSEWEQLQRDIIADDQLRATYVDRAWLHGQMKAQRERLPKLLEPGQESATGKRPVLWAVAAALLATVATSAIMFASRPDFNTPVATLIQAENCKWAGSDLPTAEGASLGTGTLNLLEGIATLQFESGATVTMEAPTTLEVYSRMRCHLVEGSVVADVPESAHGFTIDAPNLEVIDQGTRFGVTASRFGNAQVMVFEGEVDVEQKGKAKTRLTEGEAIHVGHQPPPGDYELSRNPDPEPAEDGWHTVPTSYGRGQDAYIRNLIDYRPTGSGPLIMVKETDFTEGNRRRIYLTFDLLNSNYQDLQAAELVLNIEPSGLGFSVMTPDSRFAILGMPATTTWSEQEILWHTAPTIETAISLGTFEIKQGISTGTVRFTSPEFETFIREHAEELVHLVIVRETKESDNQGLVHAFASKEHPSAPPPTLRLKLK